MAITNGYATLAQLKARLNVPTATTTHDTAFEAYIETASRQIDNDLDRQFYASSSETRYYTADDALTLFLPHDVLTVSEVALLSSAAGGVRIYGWTLTTDEYDLEPYDGPPYTRLSVGGTSRYTFPLQRRGVRITGTFGYCALATVPKPISVEISLYLEAVGSADTTGHEDMGASAAMCNSQYGAMVAEAESIFITRHLPRCHEA